MTAFGQPCPIEAKLTSHLTISYSAATAAGGAASTTAGSSTAPAGAIGTSAANFLEALIDELLSGANPAAKSPTGSATDPAATTKLVGSATSPQTSPVPFGDAVDPASATAGATTTQPQAKMLLAKLARELKALEDQLKSGDTPDPNLLQQLGQTADAVAALMAQPAQAAATTPATSDNTGDTSAIIGAVSGAVPTASAPPTTPPPLQSGTPAPANDQAAQFLASLGLSFDQQQATPSPAAASGDTTSTAPAPSVSASSPPLPGIADLASQLADVVTTVQAVSPTIAQKLQNLSQKLNAAEIDPQSLGALTTTDDSSGKSLDTLVQSLLATKPASITKPATPSVPLASDTRLPIPDALVKVTSPSQANASSTKSQPAQLAPEASTAAQPAPLQNQSTTPSSGTTDNASVAARPEAKLVADAVAKTDPAKTDATDPTSPAPDATNAVAAPIAQPAPRMIPAAYQAASAAAVNMGQVAFEMARQIQDGQSRFSIRLDPAELGRVDVKMHVDASGNVNAHLTVERSETLDMFQRDKGSLERALSQVGVDTGKTNLQFSLRQNPFAGMMGGGQHSSSSQGFSPRFSASADDDADDALGAVPQVTLYRGVASAGGVNLFA